jgi:hypothetical protein
LRVAGWPVPLSLVEEPRIDITATDPSGTSTQKSQPIVLRDDAETVVELHVPEGLVTLRIEVRGRVRVVSTQQTIDVLDSMTAEVNQLHTFEATEAVHLAKTSEGYVLSFLGKAGEPRRGRALSLVLSHAAVHTPIYVALETDERGRVELGPLEGVAGVTATLPSGVTQTFTLRAHIDPPRVVHAIEGATITLPAPRDAIDQTGAALVETTGAVTVRDVTSRMRVDRGAFVIEGLEPGRYSLVTRASWPIAITVAPRQQERAWLPSGHAMLELSPVIPIARSIAREGDEIAVRISGAGPRTRVHVVLSRFLQENAIARTLARAPRAPSRVETPAVLSHYASNRDIGDEYRYVLERKKAPRRPGTLLEKPGLLLNPWSTRTTSTAVQEAKVGAAYGASAARPAAAAPMAQAYAVGAAAGQAAYATYDFLAAPCAVLANLRPDESGAVRVPIADLGGAQLVKAYVVDPAYGSSVELALPETELRTREVRLKLALDPERHFVEERRVDGIAAGASVAIEDVRTGKIELVDTIRRAHRILVTLGAPDPLSELAFLTEWHTLDRATRRARYSKYACHEVHLFLAMKDPAFFAEVVRPYLAHKRHKSFVDRWLLDEDLSAYLEPWAFGRLNTLEKVLLARRVPRLGDTIARLIGDAVDLLPRDPERDARLVDTLLGASALEGGGIAAAAAMEMDELLADAPSPAPRRRAAEASAPPAPPPPSMPSPGFGPPPGAMGGAPFAAPAPGPGPMPPFDTRSQGGDTGAMDLAQREKGQPLFRSADKTKEWAENDWWHVRAKDAGAALVPPNRFWQDLARHREGPFLSAHLAECTSSFSESLSALAFLDLPFEASEHAQRVEDARLTLTLASHALVARTRILEVSAPEAASPLLVGQSYFRADDRWEWDGSEQREKYVTGELLTGVVYQCRVVVTNPTSARIKLEVLQQIPRGAVPVASGFLTKTGHAALAPYATESLEYAFYFPDPGTYTHFPAHVAQGGKLAAWASARELAVVETPSAIDTGSWPHISQRGSLEEVLAYLERANLQRTDLGRIAWRMHDASAFARVTALLSSRCTFHDRLWSYALRHRDSQRMAEWLRHQDGYLLPAGPVLERGVVPLDPIERRWLEHLEYAPLVNARAHQLGAKRKILNDALAEQYRAFLDAVAHRARPNDDDLLAAVHYLFSMDRVDDARALLARVDTTRVATRLQHDYLAAYAASVSGDLSRARELAAPWRDHAVDRWRHRFAAVLAMLDEAEGAPAAAAIDADSRDQRMAESAAKQPALEVRVEHGALVVTHHNLASCELLFSRQPFVQGDVQRFSFIEPGHVELLAFAEDGRTELAFPAALRGTNLVIEAVAGGLRTAIAHYAHDLSVQLAHQYGQLKVVHASTQRALPATYVKVFGRQSGGRVSFYKDGYTDVRGRFDYATLSTDDLDRVERFAILVASDDAGATVVEAPPPPR